MTTTDFLAMIEVDEATPDLACFWLTAAEAVGPTAVRATHEDLFRKAQERHDLLAGYVIVLNHKIWQHFRSDEPLALTYDELWRDAHSWCLANLDGDELAAYLWAVD